MALRAWIRSWKRSLERRWALQQAFRRHSVVRLGAIRPRLEALEDRWLLSTYVVTSTADDGSSGTLRDAINQANMAGSTITEIDFNIGASGSDQTIDLTSQLPALTANGVFINGLSQGGIGNTTQLITLNGTNAGAKSDGLLLKGSSCTVSGLIIEDFGFNGIEVDGSTNTIGGTASGAGNVISGNTGDGVLIDSSASGVAVQGNFIGTDATGAKAVANSIGIEAAGSSNTIGGTSSAARNIISGNSNDGVLIDSSSSGVAVQGNYIGTDVTGTKAVANSIGVEVKASNIFLGSTVSGAWNVISGNKKDGVLIDGGDSGVAVQGNYIGTDVTGTKAVANSIGVEVKASTNTVGGTAGGAGNLISGNTYDGVLIDNSASGVAVQGNYIGTDAAGNAALGNGNGISLDGANNNTIGGTASGASNLISGNGEGVDIVNASSNQVLGDFIGTNAAGNAALANGNGIYLDGSNNIVGGTVSGASNLISGNGEGVDIVNASSNQVLGNYIGTDAAGNAALANGDGISIGGNNNTVGGTVTGASNLISGNGTGVFVNGSGNQVLGNSIGTNVAGTTALGNFDGISIGGSNNTVGGTVSAARNLISGNGGYGVYVTGSSNQVLGNYIGTDATGNAALANTSGISLRGSNNTVGGTVSGASNLISGNHTSAVDVSGSGNQVLGNSIGTNAAGNAALANGGGIAISGDGNTVGGTVSGAANFISGNKGAGVQLDGSSNQVMGNYIGTDVTGEIAIGNGAGIDEGGSNNTIGGTSSAARNIISGNLTQGVVTDVSGLMVQGNYIGTDVTGTKAVANSIGILIAGGTNDTIGGTTPGAGNVISGNLSDGLFIGSDSGVSGTQVQGNLIGTDATGANAVANGIGISDYGSGNTIGGTAVGAGNIISGNSTAGVLINSGNLVLGNSIGTNAAGNAAVANSIGIEIDGSNNTVGGTVSAARNLISGNTHDGMAIDGNNNQVLGNYIGTDVTGTKAVANSVGVEVKASNNFVGGTATGAGNVISGNSLDGVLIDRSVSGVQVQGNYIGTNATGNEALANESGIDIDGSSNTVGGTASAARNLISGNIHGVLLSGSGDQVLGNYIGTNAAGNAALANSVGIHVASDSNTIGGSISGAGNLISGNTGDGIFITNGVNDAGSGNQVLGNSIGTDVTGANAVANSIGIEVHASTNTIGGTAGGAGNLISGNSRDGVRLSDNGSGNQVLGNSIGTDITGNAALPNSTGIDVETSYNDTIGGTASAARNLISGNSSDGVVISSGGSGNQVLGNYIGTDITGTKALGDGNGVEVDASNNSIGGSVASAGNIIANNSKGGVLVNSTAQVPF